MMTWWVVVDEVIRGEIEVIGVLKGGRDRYDNAGLD